MNNKDLKLEQKPNSKPMPMDSTSAIDCTKPNVVCSASMQSETLAVIVKTKDGKLFQVALTDEMINCLYIDLKNYFKGGIIKVLPDEIKGIEIGLNPNFKK